MLLVCNFLEMFLFIKLQELGLQMEHFHLFCFWTNQNQNQTEPTKQTSNSPIPTHTSHAVGKYKTCSLLWQNAGAVARVRTQERRGAGASFWTPSLSRQCSPVYWLLAVRLKAGSWGNYNCLQEVYYLGRIKITCAVCVCVCDGKFIISNEILRV